MIEHLSADFGAAEVGIVGAGFAGLASALFLRRHRHSVAVFDGGPSRNAWAHEVHSYLGIPHIAGAEMRRLGCEQVVEVGGQIIQARVGRVERVNGAFILMTEDDRTW